MRISKDIFLERTPRWSHDADHCNTAGTGSPGYIPRARVHVPAGQAQLPKSPKLRTQQATERVRRCYYDKVYVGARLKLYVQRTLERSCTGSASHTTAPAVWHTVPSCRRTCWVRTPLASRRYMSTHLRLRLPINVHILGRTKII